MLTVTTPGGPIVLGPGVLLEAFTDLLPLDNPPYSWTFSFGSGLELPNWTQQVVTTTTTERARIRILWQDTTTPSSLLQDVHATVGQNIAINVTVRNQAGEPIDQLSPTINAQWQPEAVSHAETALWANNIVSRLQGGAGSDQLDRIESAVYQVFPHG